MKFTHTCCFLLLSIGSFAQQKTDTGLLASLMQSKPQQFEQILRNKDSFRVQVLYTQIDRTKHNKPVLTHHGFNLDADMYFYPASTVKMPITFLALEKLNEMKAKGVNMHTTIITDSADMAAYKGRQQHNSMTKRPTIARFIQQIFLVSDNDAYNRLYEFLGQEYIQRKLTEKGYPDAIIRHRLSVSRTDEQNRRTGTIFFLDDKGGIIHEQAPQVSKAVFPAFHASLGKGYVNGGKIITEPFVFDEKNRVSLSDFQQMLQSVMMPESVSKKKRFSLTPQDYDFLYRCMSIFPPESKAPVYDSTRVWDAAVKFLMYGAERGSRPKHIRIFNKIGGAYGFLCDIAYIVDFEKNIEFLLSAAILCNSDGIFNDDTYDYATLGYPFLRDIGQLVYEYELERKKQHQPNLKKYQVIY